MDETNQDLDETKSLDEKVLKREAPSGVVRNVCSGENW